SWTSARDSTSSSSSASLALGLFPTGRRRIASWKSLTVIISDPTRATAFSGRGVSLLFEDRRQPQIAAAARTQINPRVRYFIFAVIGILRAGRRRINALVERVTFQQGHTSGAIHAAH